VSRAIIFALGLTAGNLIYAAVFSKDYGAALERSYFQFLALIAYEALHRYGVRVQP